MTVIPERAVEPQANRPVLDLLAGAVSRAVEQARRLMQSFDGTQPLTMKVKADDGVRRRCTGAEGCRGVLSGNTGRCLAHLAGQELEMVLTQIRQEGTALDLSGANVDQACLDTILPLFRDGEDHTRLPAFQASGATFEGEVSFEGMVFTEKADFEAAIFEQGATFERATFEERANFRRARFKGDARFAAATFTHAALFDYATFESDALFGYLDRAALVQSAVLSSFLWKGDAATSGASAGTVLRRLDRIAPPATFKQQASFADTTFKGKAYFRRVSFEQQAKFTRAAFEATAAFSGATFQGTMNLQSARFDQARQIGPILAHIAVDLREAVFKHRVQIEVSSPELLCNEVLFLGGAHLQVRWARIELDDADFVFSSIVSRAEGFGESEKRFLETATKLPGPPREADDQPWIVSLQRANVGGLRLSDVNLQACKFRGAHNLDQIRLDNAQLFSATPGWHAVSTGWAWPPVWRWSRRRTLAEEHHWRERYERGIRRAGWHSEAPESWLAETDHWVEPHGSANEQQDRSWRSVILAALDLRHARERVPPAWKRHIEAVRERRNHARRVANVYRALRKAWEDRKDEPGAADFYYGEMDMRRKATTSPAERMILLLYWLISGYALRASRALVSLAVAMTMFALLFVHVGFAESSSADQGAAADFNVTLTSPRASTVTIAATTDPPDTGYWGAVVYSARTAIGLPRTPQPKLEHPQGDIIQIALRITVPLLIALAVLSIRGRVKR
jgi:uncharacterized protein YjbI with pentapeptide repeats